MKKILLSLVATLLVTSLSGCNPSTSSTGHGPGKQYELEGGKVTFVPPPSPWKEQLGTESAEIESGAMSDKETNIGVSFHKPDSEGFFAVGSMEQNAKVETDANGKETGRSLIELENDQDTLNIIAFWVLKRDGKILKQEYIPLAGANAFRMEFELDKPEEKMKGQQVHFTKDGTHWTLSMLMPAKDYSAEVKHFQTMVSSFQLESSQRRAGEPVATATP